MQNPASVAACACATAIPRARHEFSHYIIAYTARRRVGAWWWTAVCMVAAANLILPFFPVWIASTRASRIHTYSSCVIEMRWHSFHTIRGSHFILCNSNMHICLSAQTDSRNMIFTWMHWSAVWACHLFEKVHWCVSHCCSSYNSVQRRGNCDVFFRHNVPDIVSYMK